MTDAIDNHFDCAAGLHGTDTDRSTAGNDIARFESHVMRDHADQLEWRENHVADRIILAFLTIQDSLDDKFVRVVDSGNNTRAERARCV